MSKVKYWWCVVDTGNKEEFEGERNYQMCRKVNKGET